MNTMFNWKLYHTFKKACDELELNITYTHGTCKIGKKDWPAYVILWTPMNKLPIWDKSDRMERVSESNHWKFELEGMENNVDDFHVEIASNDLDNMMKASAVGWWKLCDPVYREPTVERWLDIIDFCQSQDRIDKEYFMYKLQEDPEEETA